MPNFRHEKKLWEQHYNVIGIDEVGRGCLAGPIYVSAVSFTKPTNLALSTNLEDLGINDSKKLSSQKREELFTILPKFLTYSIGSATTEFINQHGIVKALQSAIHQALDQLFLIYHPGQSYILYDGSIAHTYTAVPTSQTATFIKGDNLSLSIAAASIMAKVSRDRYMTGLGIQFPEYQWQENKGYGTVAHRNAIKTHGASIHHRSLYLRKLFGTL